MNQNNNKTLKNELEDLQYELSIVFRSYAFIRWS